MLTDFKPRFSLWPMPCGCVLEGAQIESGMVSFCGPLAVVECPWCGAAFDGDELKQWVREGAPEVALQRPSCRLVVLDGALLEVESRCGCGCGALVLREPRCAANLIRSPVVVHLVPPPDLEFLAN